jgi:hypothetical protein
LNAPLKPNSDETLYWDKQSMSITPENTPDMADKPSDLAKVEKFLENIQKYSFKLPTDYTFNRDEIYDR